jgi:hypothetical protein
MQAARALIGIIMARSVEARAVHCQGENVPYLPKESTSYSIAAANVTIRKFDDGQRTPTDETTLNR